MRHSLHRRRRSFLQVLMVCSAPRYELRFSGAQVRLSSSRRAMLRFFMAQCRAFEMLFFAAPYCIPRCAAFYARVKRRDALSTPLMRRAAISRYALLRYPSSALILIDIDKRLSAFNELSLCAAYHTAATP